MKTNFDARAGCNTKSIFQRSLTSLNSEFLFDSNANQTDVKSCVCPIIYSLLKGK